MQKVRTIDWLAGFLAMMVCTALAQGAQESTLTVNDLIQRAKDERQREALGRKGEPGKPGLDATMAIDPPQLMALYGVGSDITAEISYDGRIRVIRQSGALSDMGEWRHVELLPHGVRLTTAAWETGQSQTSTPASSSSSSSSSRQAQAQARLPAKFPTAVPSHAAAPQHMASASASVPASAGVGERACVPQSGCLLLSVARPQPPGAGAEAGATADAAVDPMAAALIRQPPPGGGSVPFLGKPAPLPATR